MGPLLDVLASALSSVVPVLSDRVGVVLRPARRTSEAAIGFGILYRLMDPAGVMSTAGRYGYAVGRSWPPSTARLVPMVALWALAGMDKLPEDQTSLCVVFPTARDGHVGPTTLPTPGMVT